MAVACCFVALAAASCGDSGTPTTPTPPMGPTTPTDPDPGTGGPSEPAPNAAPTIKALYTSSSRVEADETIDLAADVQDVETSLDQLTYQWSSDKEAGTFIGAGRIVRWQAPHLQKTPDPYVLTLTVIERYTVNGETKENRTSSSVTVHYNDSYREIRDLSLTFLTNFSTYSVSPETCVASFSDSCQGKVDELGDIRVNRRDYVIQSGTFSVSSITLDGGRMDGTATLPCQFVSIRKDTGLLETATGTCVLTATYEAADWRWYLCSSRFYSSSPVSAESLAGLVP